MSTGDRDAVAEGVAGWLPGEDDEAAAADWPPGEDDEATAAPAPRVGWSKVEAAGCRRASRASR
jgi:hypothetical protein